MQVIQVVRDPSNGIVDMAAGNTAEAAPSSRSLPVDNVQTLAANLGTSTDIPPRYIRPELAESVIIHHAAEEIPVIDLDKLLDPELCHAESSKLDLACQHWGFFQLINHGVPKEVMERMMLDVEGFFKLPLEEKLVIKQPPGEIEGYGQLFVISDEQKLDWADLLHFYTSPLHLRKMGLWPTKPATFRDALDKYMLEVKRVVNCLLGFVAQNLGLDTIKLTAMFENGMQSVRINYYPPCPQAEKVLGLSPHSDASFLTLVLQVNDVQGLQIKKNDKWVPVKPLPGAFVVNVGDLLEIISNGKYRSIEHRAVTNTERERMSVAAFHSPSADATLGPHPDLVKGGEPRYKSVNHETLLELFFSSKLDGKGLLDCMKLNK